MAPIVGDRLLRQCLLVQYQTRFYGKQPKVFHRCLLNLETPLASLDCERNQQFESIHENHRKSSYQLIQLGSCSTPWRDDLYYYE